MTRLRGGRTVAEDGTAQARREVKGSLMKMHHPAFKLPFTSACSGMLGVLLGGVSLPTAIHAQGASIRAIVAPGSPATVKALNDHGRVAGYFFESESVQRAFSWRDGVPVDLGTLGGAFSLANALNNSDVVVGFSSLSGEAVFRAFGTDDLQMIDGGTLGGTFSAANAISDAGHVAGDSNLAEDASAYRVYLRHPDGSLMNLGTLGGSWSTAVAVNNAGHVVGYSVIAEDAATRAFLHNGVTMLDLGTLGGGYSEAVDINQLGHVAGNASVADGAVHAFLHLSGVMRDVGTLGGTSSEAVGVNDSGLLAGNSTIAGDAATRGFVYRDGVMTDLGSLGSGASTASAVNNRGQVVGTSADASGQPRAFLWYEGTMTDLNSLLPAGGGWALTSALFINENQQVVGEGWLDGVPAWYLLTLTNGQQTNRPPVANAGPDAVAACGGLVALDGSASGDPDGDTLTFEWVGVSGVLGNTARLEVVLPPGVHVVTLRVSDSAGASAEDSVQVTVDVDRVAPQVVCPAPVTLVANERGRAAVPDLFVSLEATDNCTAATDLRRQQVPAAGTLLKCGSHTVNIWVSDAASNVTRCVVALEVVDRTPPTLSGPDEVFRRVGTNCAALVPDLRGRVQASDNCTPAGQLIFTQMPAAGSVVEAGLHELEVTATDRAGNSASVRVRLVVADTTAPRASCVTPDVKRLQPADGRMVPVTLTVHARDNCDPQPHARIVSVVSSQPETGLTDATAPDWVVTGDLTVNLRAETSSVRSARVYFILVEISDRSGNTTHRAVWIRVPRG